MPDWIDALLTALALPQYGLGSVLLLSFLAATVLPLSSEAAVLGLIHLNSGLLWPTMAVATLGNTAGGLLTWWMGRRAWRWLHRGGDARRQAVSGQAASATQQRARRWLQALGPAACFAAFLPVLGDALCAAAGWLRLPFWPCALWMAAGKFSRYLVLTAAWLQWA